MYAPVRRQDLDGDDIELSDLRPCSPNEDFESHRSNSHGYDDDGDHGGFQDEDIFADENGASRKPSNLPLDKDSHYLWEDPWLPSVAITMLLVVPSLGYSIWIAFRLTGRMWSCSLFVLHLILDTGTCKSLIPDVNPLHQYIVDNNSTARRRISCCCYGRNKITCFRIFAVLAALFDIASFGILYPKIMEGLVELLFTDEDGTTVIEWTGYIRDFQILRIIGYAIAALRCFFGLLSFVIRCCKWIYPERLGQWRPSYWDFPFSCGDNNPMESSTVMKSSTPSTLSDSELFSKESIVRSLRHVLSFSTYASALLLVWCSLALMSHFGPWPMPTQEHADCDPLDPTECILPFPSFHHMKPDRTTVTGWRVNIDRHVFPPMRGGLTWSASFLSTLDGFSTMAPILFYIEGMKEGHESAEGNVKLQGPERIEYSVTSSSVTLLLDVKAQELVYHSAEIDYLDRERPLVLVFPSSPLKHNTHYALAVINAHDGQGNRLPQSDGMSHIFKSTDNGRRKRYQERVIPALEAAAPWFSFLNDPGSLQLLFDFQTISEESQLGLVRGVRDATMAIINRESWEWKNHVRTVRIEEGNCDADGDTLVARTIHAELDVPWFLESFGPGGRSLELDRNAVASRKPVSIGRAKFMVRVPCSVREAAVGGAGKKVRAIMEYGHGLFASRNELTDRFLSKMANDNGYILTAMDWRGMSKFDLPVVVKVMLGEPNLFGAIRDNMIQGYANKLALQHFSAKHLLEMDWLRFEGSKIPLWHYRKIPTRVFYGISQGGILGAGYAALSGPTKLIDRAVLGVPGTPFALVMSRSLDFVLYDTLLLFSFYHNRHIRILLSLLQMGWDSLEASGLLAPPVNEQYPRLLLQAGLGDPVVPTSAAEALGRALGASILPKNPRQIFGIPVSHPSNQTWMGPDVTLTEVLYEKEYNMLPLDDVFGPNNNVHICVRLDQNLQQQLTAFVNSDRVIDPCEDDECRRDTTC